MDALALCNAKATFFRKLPLQSKNVRWHKSMFFRKLQLQAKMYGGTKVSEPLAC